MSVGEFASLSAFTVGFEVFHLAWHEGERTTTVIACEDLYR
jgi:hypothetical protein